MKCEESVVLCKALCGHHGADHEAFNGIQSDKAIDTTISMSKENGSYEDEKICRSCSSE